MTTGLTAEVLLKYLINCSKLGGILKNPEKKNENTFKMLQIPQ